MEIMVEIGAAWQREGHSGRRVGGPPCCCATSQRLWLKVRSGGLDWQLWLVLLYTLDISTLNWASISSIESNKDMA